MRTELQNIERVELYFNNELSTSERIIFENELNSIPAFKDLFENLKNIRQAAIRKAIKEDIARYGSSGSSFKYGKWIGLFLGLITITTLTCILLFAADSKIEKRQQTKSIKQNMGVNHNTNPKSKETTPIREDEAKVKQNETKTKKVIVEDTYCGGLKTWVKPNIQTFSIDAQKGATIEGENGTLIVVPSDAFISSDGSLISGNVDFELVEALNVSDMIAYNLTTMNDNKALMSGGMVYTQAYLNGKKLSINPSRPLYIEIPTEEYNSDMLAWNGVINEQGNINWEKPTALKRYLTKIDFDNLDFLPNGFEAGVKAGLPFKNHTVASKFLVDSLYYALGDCKDEDVERVSEIANTPCGALDALNKYKGLVSSRFESQNLETTLVDENNEPLRNVYYAFKVRGEAFAEGTTDKNGTLKTKLLPGDYQLKVCINDTTYYRNGVAMDPTNKRRYVIEAIKINIKPKKNWKTLNTNIKKDSITQTCFINPLSIKTIKTDAFQNSFLATKEFEQRIKILHQLPNAQQLFDLYVNNLTKDLWEVDQMVSEKLTGDDKTIFENLAKQKLTNIENLNIYQEQLSKYYNNKKKEDAIALKKAQEEYAEISTAELNQYQKEINQLQTKIQENLIKEQKFIDSRTTKENEALKNNSVARLNNALPVKNNILPRRSVVGSNSVYAIEWYSFGWMNIDAYLHLLDKGRKEVIIETKEKQVADDGTKIYQCLNTLKTIIPLKIKDSQCKALFPEKGNPRWQEMSNTFAVGISKNGGELKFVKINYNPYITDKIDLNWQSISEEDLMIELRKLDVGGNLLIEDFKKQEKMIQEQLLIEAQKAEFKAEREKIKEEIKVLDTKVAEIQERQKIERNFINSLLQICNKCGADGTFQTNEDKIELNKTNKIIQRTDQIQAN